MKTQLPTSTKFSVNRSSKGFTLVELLVVISILAILGVIGITIFSGTQKGARDAKRKEDIVALSNAMEAQRDAQTGYLTTVQTSWFADGSIPKPPSGVAGVTDYTSTNVTTSTYVFCAALEASTGNATSNAGAGMTGTTTGSFFCRKQAQ